MMVGEAVYERPACVAAPVGSKFQAHDIAKPNG
jgi:hypothetical protein